MHSRKTVSSRATLDAVTNARMDQPVPGPHPPPRWRGHTFWCGQRTGSLAGERWLTNAGSPPCLRTPVAEAGPVGSGGRGAIGLRTDAGSSFA